MKDPLHHDPIDALGAIYEKMYEYTVENFHKAENKTEQLANKLIEEAKDNVLKLEKLSKKEAEDLTHYLKRDLSLAAKYFSNTKHELKDWLGFETSLLEHELLDLLLQAADTTSVKLLQFKDISKKASSYKTGEITGPGTLICEKCGEKLYFYKAGRIPPCTKCNATTFYRNINKS